MVKRPLIEEIPEDEDYTKTIKFPSGRMKGWFSYDTWILIVALIVYVVVGCFLEIKLTHLWLIGFPVALALWFLKTILATITIATYEGGRKIEYYHKHLLYRMEEMHKTLEK